jgi:HK97 family phage major capsid protein/HK97 family phage prohead protease
MKIKKLFRVMDSRDIKIDEENRTIEFPFSSELPVNRWFGKEILSHEGAAINLERASAGAMPLLFNHNMDDLRGKLERVWLGADKRLWTKARFAKTEAGKEALELVKDGMLPNVSFGYMVEEFKLTKSNEDGLDEYTATKWTPYEVSLVTVPADHTVGIGRSEDGDEYECKLINDEIPEGEKEEKIQMPNPDNNIEINKERELARNEERSRVAQINAIGDKFEQRELARNFIDNGKSIEEFRTALLEKVGQKQVALKGNETDVGLSQKEINKFSFVRAMHAMANPQDRAAQEAASFEREVSEAAAKRSGQQAKGFLIPVDVLRAGFKRDLVVGTPSAGGDLVAENLLGGSFIELLRKKSVMSRLGVTNLNGLIGNIAIPRQTSAATAYWVGEQIDITKSQQGIDQVSMTPKTVGARTEYSRSLLLQSSIDVEAMVRNDLSQVCALEVDRVALYGSGSGSQPTGLKLTSGINTKDFTAAAPTWDEVVGMETEVGNDNADIGALKYATNALGRGLLKTTKKDSGSGIFLLEDGMVNGYGIEFSNQIATLSSTDPDIWFGNWADMIIGSWGGLDLIVDPYSGSASGTVRVVLFQSIDIGVRHPESFCYGNKTI